MLSSGVQNRRVEGKVVFDKSFEGLIGFSSSPSWISRVIRWFTKSRWSHCFVVWKVLDGENGDGWHVLVIEAGEFTVQIVPFAKYLRKDSVFELYDVSSITDNALKERADLSLLKQVETLYGWLQLIGFGIVILMRKWFGLKRRHNIFGMGKICSEVVAEYLLNRGVKREELCGDKDINLISPQDIYVFVRSKNCPMVLTKNGG